MEGVEYHLQGWQPTKSWPEPHIINFIGGGIQRISKQFTFWHRERNTVCKGVMIWADHGQTTATPEPHNITATRARTRRATIHHEY